MNEPAKTVTLPNPFRLHIGGKHVLEGWHILNVQAGPGVNFVGNVTNLTPFPDGCCDEIYASHVLEHLSHRSEFVPVIGSFHRMLKPGGTLRISVPDLDVLSRLMIDPALTLSQRYHVMAIMFGGQTDEHDFHKIGINFAFLENFLQHFRFREITRVPEFGIFRDSSSLRYADVLISLNVLAKK